MFIEVVLIDGLKNRGTWDSFSYNSVYFLSTYLGQVLC